MANFTWTFDAPTGVYKSHKMSQRLWEAAVENSIFLDHTRPIDGFGKKQGESVTITRIGTIAEPASAALIESVRIPEDTFSLSTKAFTAKELGRSVPYTNLSMDLSEFDLENPIQRKLRDQMRLVLDTMAAGAFKKTKIKYVPTGATSNNITTNGTPGAAATSNLNVWHIEEMRDYMYDTLRVPPAADGDYIGIFRTLGMRGIKRDSAWAQWHQYTDPQAKYNGEVGRIESVRFIETNHANALGKVGTGSVLGEGVVFGDEAAAMVEVLTPELRAAIPADFGRARAVAWYGILDFDIIWETANPGEARVIHVTSA
jgi:N4-gp56 family major capsid protein